jgi:butyryl-CoA dehydrogenase
MTVEFMSRRNLNFVLYEMLDAEGLTKHDQYAEHSRETFDAVIDVAEQIAREKFYPHLMASDAREPEVVNGKVQTIPEIKEAIAAYAEAGFISAHHRTELGGIQLPRLIALACQVWFSGANAPTTTYLGLTKAAANLIEAYGTPDQKARFLPAMLEGRCLGTMNLSEPQAGSSLGDIATAAIPTEGGHYLIKGNKTFISGGEHEMTENILHLVLARIKGAPVGVKGLSLFMVPRYRLTPDGSPGESNDVALAGLIHKMGWRGTNATMLNFGENDDCHGYLIGEPGKGLACMFHMMNEARVNVGMGATMLGYAGYLYALDYARNRPQGRLPGNNDPTTRQVMLIEHADVRRMLLLQKSYVEGTFALGFYAAWLLDQQKSSPSEQGRKEAGLLLDILTPIIKAWSSELCIEANSQAMQVMGGYGYTRDYPVEQYFRTNRLNAIFEGTNGIQAIDLLGRKVSMNNGAAFRLLTGEIGKTVEEAGEDASLREMSQALRRALQTLEETTAALLARHEQAGTDLFLANASPYLAMAGHVVMAWMWLRQAITANRKVATAGGSDLNFYQGKLQACRYYFRWELPKTGYLSRILNDMDPTCHAMEDAWF